MLIGSDIRTKKPASPIKTIPYIVGKKKNKMPNGRANKKLDCITFFAGNLSDKYPPTNKPAPPLICKIATESTPEKSESPESANNNGIKLWKQRMKVRRIRAIKNKIKINA